MNQLEKAKAAIDACSAEEQRLLSAWLRDRYPIHSLEKSFGAAAEVILEAIGRASDLSRRGVLGLIAEASFQVNVIERLTDWENDHPSGDAPFDFRIRRGADVVRIQVKRQRLVRGQPMMYPGGSSKFVAETQRSRTGTVTATGESTRPYRFGEFDVLAVCMQPSTGDWSSFRYTPQRWLLPRDENQNYLRVLQPVSLEPDENWTDEIHTVLRWLVERRAQRIAQA